MQCSLVWVTGTHEQLENKCENTLYRHHCLIEICQYFKNSGTSWWIDNLREDPQKGNLFCQEIKLCNCAAKCNISQDAAV